MSSNKTLVQKAAIAAVAILGSVTGMTSTVSAGDVSIGIRIGEPAPPPRQVVVQETRVVRYDTYVVGGRRALYDADLRLREAQADEIESRREVEAARRREGEIAIALDDVEARVGELRSRGAAAAGEIGELRVRLGALEKRLQNAKEDWDAAKVLRDPRGSADAERRVRENEVQVAGTIEELRRAEDSAAVRGRLLAAQDEAARLRADLNAAHDGVFAAQERLAGAHDRVCIALHDRDESLWLIYRDDIIVGRVRPETVGFRIDLAAFGGRMPRDPEVLHAHFVRDSGYWRERPVEIETRVVEVDRVPEIATIRVVQRDHDAPRFKRIETVETTVTVEERRRVAETVVVEQKRYQTEVVERKTASSQGKKYEPDPKERAEAKAIVMKAHAEAKATETKAQAEAKATREEAHADAKSKVLAAEGQKEQAHADAKSKVIDAKSDAKAQTTQAHADAKVTEAKGAADARVTKEQGHADARATREQSHADAKVTEAKGVADARATKEQAHADAKVTESRGAADARATKEQAHADAKATEIRAKSDSRTPAVGNPRDDKKTADRGGSSSPGSGSKVADRTGPPSSKDSRDTRSSKDDRSGKPKDPKDPRNKNADNVTDAGR